MLLRSWDMPPSLVRRVDYHLSQLLGDPEETLYGPDAVQDLMAATEHITGAYVEGEQP